MMLDKIIDDKKLLEKQLYWLDISYNNCKNIGIKYNYSVEEFDKFETLCSRYSRGIDFLIRRIYRSIDIYEFESPGTLVDVINNANKRNLIRNIDEFRIMKDIRNNIVHEYIEDELTNIFEEVLKYSYDLIKIIKVCLRYIEDNFLISSTTKKR